MRILVAGAGGYLGGRISLHLASQGHQVSVLVHHHLPTGASEWSTKMDRVIVGDARNRDVLLSTMENEIDCIIYTIALKQNDSNNDLYTSLSVNMGILWTLLELCAQKGTVKLLYLSTVQVYGLYPTGEPIHETAPLLAVKPYGLTHKFCEDLCSLYTTERGLDCTSLRISNGLGAPAFSPANCWQFMATGLCKSATEKEGIRLQSDGTLQRDIIDVSDICRAVELLATSPTSRVRYRQYNLCSGRTSTVLELAHEIADVYEDRYHKHCPVVFPDGSVSPNAVRHKDIPRFTYDTERLQSLGITAFVDLHTSINEVLNYLEAQ